jgi:hypothetical protein
MPSAAAEIHRSRPACRPRPLLLNRNPRECCLFITFFPFSALVSVFIFWFSFKSILALAIASPIKAQVALASQLQSVSDSQISLQA